MAALVNLQSGQTRTKRVQWSLTSADPNGDYYLLANRFPIKTVHVFGSFDGGVVAILGSGEDGTPSNPYVMRDVLGNSLIFKQVDGRKVMECSKSIAPALSGDNGSASVTIIMDMVVPNEQ